MSKDRSTFVIPLLLSLAVMLAAGCSAGFIRQEARSSLASFVTGVFASVVDDSIGP